jgi:HEAT repeat protein
MLLERVPAGDEVKVLRDADPRYLAHLLNTMLLRAPDEDIVSRIAVACFGEGDEWRRPDAEERYLIFLKGLKPGLNPVFRAVAGIADPESGDSGGEGEAAANVSEETRGLSAPAARITKSILGPYSPRVIRKTPDTDFIFDFVAEGKAVVHDIELRSEWLPLFHSDHLAQLLEPARTDNRTAVRKSSSDSRSFSAARVLESCAEEAVSDTAFSVLLELIGTDSLAEEAFQTLAHRLASVITFYAGKGAFGKVLEVFNALKTQSLQGTRSFQAAMMLERIFSEDRFNAIVVESLRKHGRTHREAAGKLTGALRSSLIPYLLDSLSDESDVSRRRFMISLLTASRGEVLTHIMRRLGDSRWYVLRNMLFLLRECHGRSYASEVREFLGHEVPLVRLEAARTLLSFQAPGAEQAVVKLLSADNFQLQKGAVQLAGTYRIREALPYLVRLLREKDILGKKFLIKRSIIRSLGRIGHESVLNPLLHICRETSLIHKENYDKLKVDIYRTLHHYPVTAVKPFIDYGMKTNNKEITVLSRKLADRYLRAVERQQK